jgi:DnaJ-class molecular chaperone
MAYDYWKEALGEALSEAGCFAALTDQQITDVAEQMKFAAEMESEATGRINIPNPYERELKETKTALKAEQEKVLCKECNGKGTYFHQGPYHAASGTCSKCNGEGRHKP